MEQYYDEQLAKRDEEMCLLKQKLYEQGMRRLNELQELEDEEEDPLSPQRKEESDKKEESNESVNTDKLEEQNSEDVDSDSEVKGGKETQSDQMQQELDEFAEFFDGPLSPEEQELIKQLKARESEVERIFKQTNSDSPTHKDEPEE